MAAFAGFDKLKTGKLDKVEKNFPDAKFPPKKKAKKKVKKIGPTPIAPAMSPMMNQMAGM